MAMYIEKAKSDRAKCANCKRKIKKGVLKGMNSYVAFGQRRTESFCKSCTKSLLRDDAAVANKLLRRLSK